jgi:hypothetical protein
MVIARRHITPFLSSTKMRKGQIESLAIKKYECVYFG